jgi:hypothetical protein
MSKPTARARPGSPVVALDVDGVIHPIAASVDDLHHRLAESVRLADFDALDADEQEARREWAMAKAKADLFWIMPGRSDPAAVAARSERLLREPEIPIPEGETPDSIAARLSDVTVMVTRSSWSEGAFHRSYDDAVGEGDEAKLPFVIVVWAGAWIRALVERGVEVAWSTTWGDSANAFLAPLLGIEPLPVATSSMKPRRGEGAFEWKARATRATFGDGHPIVFVDDMAYPIIANRDELMVAPHPAIGMLPSEAEKVERWVSRFLPDFEPLDVGDIAGLSPHARTFR